MRDPNRIRLFPTDVQGRLLHCTKPGCGKLIDLVEIPAPDIDPDTYVCLDHFRPVESPNGSTNASVSPSEIKHTIEPPTLPPRPLGDQIRDYCAANFGNAA